MTYSLGELKPSEFEALVTRIFSRMRGSDDFRLFQEGPDRGIDGVVLISNDDNNTKIMLQAKRQSKFRASELDTELDKFLPDEFDEYVFAHSANLSEKASREIESRFKERYGDTKITVLGGNTIQQALSEPANRPITESFPSLFLNSMEDLKFIENHSIWEYSDSRVEELGSQAESYVETTPVREMVDALLKKNVCVVSGPAGIGKTVSAFLAAKQLVRNCEEQGIIEPYRICFITQISDLYKIASKGSRVVVILDDFLGEIKLNANYVDRFTRFVDAVEYVKRAQNAKLILLTRDYILKELESERDDERDRSFFDHVGGLNLNDRDSRLEIFAGLTRQRVQQLRNISAENVTPEFEYEIVVKHAYESLLSQELFNPRALYTALAAEQKLDLDTLSHLKKVVGNPIAAIKAAARSLDPDAWNLLRIIFVSNRAFSFRDFRQLPMTFTGERREILRKLDGIWVSMENQRFRGANVRRGNHEDLRISLANPTVKEFLAARFLADRQNIDLVFEIAIQMGSLGGLAEQVLDTASSQRTLTIEVEMFVERLTLEMERNGLDFWGTRRVDSFLHYIAKKSWSSPIFQAFTYQIVESLLHGQNHFGFSLVPTELLDVLEYLIKMDTRLAKESQVIESFVMSTLVVTDEVDEWESVEELQNLLSGIGCQNMDLGNLLGEGFSDFEDGLISNFDAFYDFDDIEEELDRAESALSQMGFYFNFDRENIFKKYEEWQSESVLRRAVDLEDRPRGSKGLEEVLAKHKNDAANREREIELVKSIFEE